MPPSASRATRQNSWLSGKRSPPSGRAWPLTFDDMLTTLSREAAEPALKQELAATLMGYARANPDTIRGRAMPVIVYDPATGRDAFAVTMRKILE